MKATKALVGWTALLLGLLLAGCQPDSGTPSDRESRRPGLGLGSIGNHRVECDIIASISHESDGPNPDWRPASTNSPVFLSERIRP